MTFVQQLYFFSNRAVYGVDNCYIGPPDVMYRLCKYFHEELDKITDKYTKQPEDHEKVFQTFCGT